MTSLTRGVGWAIVGTVAATSARYTVQATDVGYAFRLSVAVTNSPRLPAGSYIYVISSSGSKGSLSFTLTATFPRP